MRVLFEVPAGWNHAVDFDWTLAVAPDATIRVLSSPLVPLGAADPDAVIARDLPSECSIEPIAETPGRTVTGWPMVTRTFRVVDRDQNTIELRVAGTYVMLAYTGVVVARIPSHDTYMRARAMLDAILASARPHLWTEDPTCVAQWFDLEAR